MTEFPALKNEFIFAEAKTMKRNPVQKTMKRNPAQKMRAIFVQTLHDNVKKKFGHMKGVILKECTPHLRFKY